MSIRPLCIIVVILLIHLSPLVEGFGYSKRQPLIRHPFQKFHVEEGPRPRPLQIRTRRQYRPAVVYGLTPAKVKAQNVERPPLPEALEAALALDLSKRQATLFAEQMFVMQLVFRSNQLDFGSSVQAFAAGFKISLNTGIAKGMSKEAATQFATAMVPTQTIFGVQSVSAIESFAESYYSALRIGIGYGMDKEQVKTFGESVVRIQADFGKQSEANVKIFAKDFIKIWEAGVEQGMKDGEVIRFAWTMLNIQARLGTMPLAEVVSYAEQFVRALVQARASGQQGFRVATGGILRRSGVSLLAKPKVKVETGKKDVEKKKDEGPVIEIAGIDILGGLKV